MTLAITVGLLVFGAVFLFSKREMLRIILGFVLLGHAGNLVLMAAGGTSRRDEPFGAPDDLSTVADPLPQAFVLTAIVIAFSITIFMLVLAVTGRTDDRVTKDNEPLDQDAERESDARFHRSERGLIEAVRTGAADPAAHPEPGDRR